jgi:hypothetical protein
MIRTSRPLLLEPPSPTPQHERLNGIVSWLAAITVHLVPFLLLLGALQAKPREPGGAFGQSVSVTLISQGPSLNQAVSQRTSTPLKSTLSSLERRLSDHGPALADAHSVSKPAPSTRLSDLFDAQGGLAGQASNGPSRPTAGTGDDPFARASVSYRGDDPIKIARLNSRARTCAQGTKAMRFLLIINSEGYLVAKPRALSTEAPEKAVLKAASAIEHCAPFADAATPGPPRSYEIDLG